MMSNPEKGPDSDPNHDFLDDYEPLNTVMRDPYGQRSMAWRHKTSDTDKLFSDTELTEARTTYPPERNMFRRLDKVACFMVSILGEKRNPRVANVLGFLCFPFVLTYLGYMILMARWDKWRAGPPPDSE